MKLFTFTKVLGALLFGAMTLGFYSCVEDDEFFNFRDDPFFVNASALIVEVGDSIVYQDSSDNFQSAIWTFTGGDIASSEERTPTVFYNEVGEYVTTVNVTLGDGSVRQRRLQIEVVPPLVPDFNATPRLVLSNINASIQLNNLTTGVPAIADVRPEMDSSVLYLWTFEGINGGDTLEANKPVIQYNEVGTYDVSLTVVRRFPFSRKTIVKEDFIEVVDVLNAEPNGIDVGRTGTRMFVRMPDPLAENADLAAAVAGMNITDASGTVVGLMDTIYVAPWNSKTLVLELDGSNFAAGSDYTVNFDGVGLLFSRLAKLGPFAQTFTYAGAPEWTEPVYPVAGAGTSGTAEVTQNGKTFSFEHSGYQFVWDHPNNALNQITGTTIPAWTSTAWNMANAYVWKPTPGAGASIDDLGPVAIDFFFLPPDGTKITFSQPVTDIDFRRLWVAAGTEPGFPVVQLSDDGLELTIVERKDRSGAAHVIVSFAEPISADGFTMTNEVIVGQEVNFYVTASVK